MDTMTMIPVVAIAPIIENSVAISKMYFIDLILLIKLLVELKN